MRRGSSDKEASFLNILSFFKVKHKRLKSRWKLSGDEIVQYLSGWQFKTAITERIYSTLRHEPDSIQVHSFQVENRSFSPHRQAAIPILKRTVCPTIYVEMEEEHLPELYLRFLKYKQGKK